MKARAVLLSEGEEHPQNNNLEAEVSLASFRNGDQTSAAVTEQSKANSEK